MDLLYLNQSYDQKGVQNIDGALFILENQVAFAIMFAVLSVSFYISKQNLSRSSNQVQKMGSINVEVLNY